MAVFELVVEVIQDLVERNSPVLPPSQETNISDVRRFDETPGLNSRGFTAEIKIYLYS